MEEYTLIRRVEPVIFLFFGVLNGSRLWAFVNRRAYAGFWLAQMRQRTVFYYVLLGAAGLLALWGLGIWFKDLGHNYWWRWLFLPAGICVLFDIASVFLRLWWWEAIVLVMYDTTSGLWSVIWGVFTALGALGLLLAVYLWWRRKKQKQWLDYEYG